MSNVYTPATYSQSVSNTPFSDYPDLLTVQHIAKITGLSVQTIRREMRVGHIPCVRVGGRRLFCPKAKFIEYINGDNAA